MIKEYTVIPDFHPIGYDLMAVTFGIVKREFLSSKGVEKARETFRKSFENASFQVIINERGLGIGYDGIAISFHKDYSDYARVPECPTKLHVSLFHRNSCQNCWSRSINSCLCCSSPCQP